MSSNVPAGTLLGHPKGLFLLFATEMWERFSYYGMRALLVLTLIASTSSANPGFGWTEVEALSLYGTFTGLCYLTPLFGGWIADNFLGQRKSIILGGLIMAAGQFTLSAAVPGNEQLFKVGLGLLIVGNGFFKPNISTMVGDLYRPGDARRDAAFTIFYMGINVGAFMAPLICSTLGESADWGWKYGYMSAGIGMLISVVTQLLLAQRLLSDVGKEPGAKRALAASGGKKEPLTQVEWDRMRVVFVLFVFIVVFWTAFEQAGGLLNIYASQKTDRFIGSFEVPAGWFQAVNSFFIVLLGPVFAMIWSRMGRAGRNPSTPTKMILGLVFTALGFMFMVGASLEQSAHGKAGMHWLVLAYMLHTMGELCISPVGLSMVTKLAPLRLASLMMGVWFLINAVANKLAGVVGAYAKHAGDLAIFGGLTVFLLIFGAGLWAISGKLVNWTHGAEDTKA
ncbi:peptide MFS transporter [Pelomonas sp. BJYL3]|uniref:peptide MFS transporter n=1 Tax=Pelomonas sp. BJYL3 TaxID=2976697 RepID=UPI0022B4538B|nr:peptide MFS transporter [Pelomonas sp. BJYL3]